MAWTCYYLPQVGARPALNLPIERWCKDDAKYETKLLSCLPNAKSKKSLYKIKNNLLCYFFKIQNKHITHSQWKSCRQTTQKWVFTKNEAFLVLCVYLFEIFTGSFFLHGGREGIGEGNGRPLQYSCLENPMNSMKRQNDRILKEVLPRLVGAHYATGDQWRNNSRKNEGVEPKQKQYQLWIWLVIEARSDAVKSNIA